MAGNAERTYLMIKPDGVQRGLVGQIVQRFEARGYKLVRSSQPPVQPPVAARARPASAVAPRARCHWPRQRAAALAAGAAPVLA